MTDLKVVEIVFSKDPVQVTNCPINYTVTEADGWDLGRPIGNGATLEDAMNDFKSSWQLKFDEEIDVLITDKI